MPVYWCCIFLRRSCMCCAHGCIMKKNLTTFCLFHCICCGFFGAVFPGFYYGVHSQAMFVHRCKRKVQTQCSYPFMQLQLYANGTHNPYHKHHQFRSPDVVRGPNVTFPQFFLKNCSGLGKVFWNRPSVVLCRPAFCYFQQICLCRWRIIFLPT